MTGHFDANAATVQHADGLVEDRHGGRLGRVGRSETTPGHQRDPQYLEIAVSHTADLHQRRVGWRWRWSFDRATGALWLGDVGQGQREEIDLVTRGSNQGWRLYEGSLSYLDPGTVPAVPVTPPVRDYGRNLGTTVIGGHVYRGDDVPTLRGSYVHGDYGSGRIWALVHDGIQVVQVQQVASLSGLVSFGEDERGELYAVSLNGTLHRLLSAGTSPDA